MAGPLTVDHANGDTEHADHVNDLSSVLQRYDLERNKRLRTQDENRYISLDELNGGKDPLQDPWIATGTPVREVVPDGGHTKVVVVGAGFGGLLCAGTLVKSGYNPQDILMVDPAGGFGGTWYWQRYPGLACDTESYTYMPFLEDLDYMPTKKYVSGEELRHHAEAVARHFGLDERAMLQTSAKAARWNEQTKTWAVELLQKPKGGVQKTVTISSDFVVLVSGIFTSARLPDVPGVKDFEGRSFHTSLWDYPFTHGSSAEPNLTGLQDKRVGIVGTGATAIQAVPQLAKWAKELYVFQRTPSAVDRRDQKTTDAKTWKSEVANKTGWQRERNANFAGSFSGLRSSLRIDVVDDGWSKARTYYALTGGPNRVTPDTISQHMTDLNVEDFPRSEGIRERVEDIVKDAQTAERLKAWYPTWCKRPTFSDEYLDAFNQHNVKLVDTGPKGIQSFSTSGPVVNNVEYPLDVVIWSTGYDAPGAQSYADKCNMTIQGKNGLTITEKFNRGFTTLHGVTSHHFPNMFFVGPVQAGVSPNFLFSAEVMSDHIAYVICKATEHAKGADGTSKVVVEATEEAEEAYAGKIASMALVNAPIAACTPSYYNMEGGVASMSMEEQIAAARLNIWGQGILDYDVFLRTWRENAGMEGLDISLHEA